MSLATNYSYRPIDKNQYTVGSTPTAYYQSLTPRIGGTKRGDLLNAPLKPDVAMAAGTGVAAMDTDPKKYTSIQSRMARGQMGPMTPQAYKDQSADTRTGLQSFFSAGARYREKDAYEQQHVSVSGVPGMVHMAVLDSAGQKIPYAPFSWGGRTYHTDAEGKFTILERTYFQNVVSSENERVKYITQMISLVIGQPAENVIAMFGLDFYRALGPMDIDFTVNLYKVYMAQAGIKFEIVEQKARVFSMYADAGPCPSYRLYPLPTPSPSLSLLPLLLIHYAIPHPLSLTDASPEVMPNYGDNDPHWTRAFNKLSALIEYHPSAILFDTAPIDPTVDSGVLEGPRDVKVLMDTTTIQAVKAEATQVVSSGANREAALPPDS